MEYMILRRGGNLIELKSIGSPGAEPESFDAPEIIFEKFDASDNDITDANRDPEVIAGARPMSMSLIESLGPESVDGMDAQQLVEASVQQECTWGVKAMKADESEFSGKGVRVAVLDTGINASHDAFAADLKIIGRNYTQKSATDKTVDPDDWSDAQGHGTHCAGTIFGRPVNGHRIGIAPGVSHAIIAKVFGHGGGSTEKLLDAMAWAIEQDADIISMSLGFDLVGYRQRLEEGGYHPKAATSMAMRELIDNVRFFDAFGYFLSAHSRNGKKPLIYAATGNGSDRFGKRFNGRSFVLDASYPSESPEFRAVSGLRQTDHSDEPYAIAEFSNSGADLTGPGVNVLSADVNSSSRLRMDSGTSMATPHVAGVAALWAQKLARDNLASAARISEEVLRSAILPSGFAEGKDVGRGLPQAPVN